MHAKSRIRAAEATLFPTFPSLEWFITKSQGYLHRRVCMRGKRSPILLSQHSKRDGLRPRHRRGELQERGIYSQLQQWFNSEPRHVGVITHCERVASYPGKLISIAAWELPADSHGPTPHGWGTRARRGCCPAPRCAGCVADAGAVHAPLQKAQELGPCPLPVRPAARPGLSKHLRTLGRT